MRIGLRRAGDHEILRRGRLAPPGPDRSARTGMSAAEFGLRGRRRSGGAMGAGRRTQRLSHLPAADPPGIAAVRLRGRRRRRRPRRLNEARRAGVGSAEPAPSRRPADAGSRCNQYRSARPKGSRRRPRRPAAARRRGRAGVSRIAASSGRSAPGCSASARPRDGRRRNVGRPERRARRREGRGRGDDGRRGRVGKIRRRDRKTGRHGRRRQRCRRRLKEGVGQTRDHPGVEGAGA